MPYIKRDLEDKIITLSKEYSCILITGPRQVGKTTVLRQFMDDVNLDEVLFAGFDSQQEENAYRVISSFREHLPKKHEQAVNFLSQNPPCPFGYDFNA